MNGGDEAKVAELRRYLDGIADELATSAALEALTTRAADFDAVYIPGGHGPMEDLPDNAALGQLVVDLYDSGRVVAAMCHGPAGLLAARRPDGGWLFAGRRVTAFTDDEERQVGLADPAGGRTRLPPRRRPTSPWRRWGWRTAEHPHRRGRDRRRLPGAVRRVRPHRRRGRHHRPRQQH